MNSRSVLFVLIGLAVICFGVIVGACCSVARLRATETRELSPDGRYEIIRVKYLGVLDSYQKLWIADPGEEDRTRWQDIGSFVEGSWQPQWIDPSHLILWYHGSVEPECYESITWRDVLIEQLPAGSTSEERPR